MDVFLLRHGTAEPMAPKDRDRRLSAVGREDLKRILAKNQQELASVELAIASPYVRTQQTLNIALPFLPLVSVGQCQVMAFLTPCGCPQEVIDWLYQNKPKAILLVTHQPLVGTLLDELCGLEPGRYRMGTGALAKVELDTPARGLGVLKWLKHAQV